MTLDRARLERAKRELALEHAAEAISDGEYLARLGWLRAELLPSTRRLDRGSRPSGSSSGSGHWARPGARPTYERRRPT